MIEIRKEAKLKMKGFCRVCPVCNGIACSGEVPGMGGLGTGSSFRANLEALEDIRLVMRTIHSVRETDTAVSLLGKELSVPLLAAPIGGVAFNMGGGVSEDDYISSIIDGCRSKGILGCTGDGVPDFIIDSALQAVKDSGGQGIPFIKPWDDRELFEKLERVQETGAEIAGIDIDAAGLITLRKMGRPVYPRPVDALKSIMERFPFRFIIKGIMTVSDALAALEAGADAIVVSNHGGRVLDHTPGTAEVLPDIADAMEGKLPVIVDGGIRTGGDILKMLALGADAVMIGRPFSVAAVGGLKEGVETLIDTLRTELEQAMVLTGTQSLKTVDRSVISIR